MSGRARKKYTRGELKECLITLGNLLDFKDSNHQQLMQAFSLLSKIPEQTLTGFLIGEKIPDGLNELRLYCCFTAIGFEVIEFSKRQVPHHEVIELLGYNIVTPQEAVAVLKYSKPFNLYEAIRKEFKYRGEKSTAVWELWVSHKEAVEQARIEYRKRLHGFAELLARSLESSSVHHAPVVREDETVAGTVPNETLAVSALAIMDGLAGLLTAGAHQALVCMDSINLKTRSEGTIRQLSLYLNELISIMTISEGGKEGVPDGDASDLHGGCPKSR